MIRGSRNDIPPQLLQKWFLTEVKTYLQQRNTPSPAPMATPGSGVLPPLTAAR